MFRKSQISLCKLIFRYPFQGFHKPTSRFSFHSIATVSFNRVSNPFPAPKSSIFDAPTSNSCSYPCFCRLNLTKFSSNSGGGDSMADFDQDKEVDMINLRFAEAREEIEMALESKETVYFDEEAECARAAVKEVLDMFEGLLGKLPENKRAALQRAMGLKMEQLKAEIQQLDD